MVEPFFLPRPSPHASPPPPNPLVPPPIPVSASPASPPHSSLRPLCVACKPCQLQETPPSRLCNSCATLRASGVAPSVVSRKPSPSSHYALHFSPLFKCIRRRGMHSQPSGAQVMLPVCLVFGLRRKIFLSRLLAGPARVSARPFLTWVVPRFSNSSPVQAISNLWLCRLIDVEKNCVIF